MNSFHRIHRCPLTPLFQLIIPRSICTFSLSNFVSLSLHRLKLRLQRNNRAVTKRNEAGKSFKRVKNVSVEWKIEEDRFFVSKLNESAAISQGAAALGNVANMKRVSSSILKQLARSSERTVATNRSSSLLRCLSRIVSMSKDSYTS